MTETVTNTSDRWPNLYEDNKSVGELSTRDITYLQNKLGEYSLFLSRTDLMPQARTQAERFMTHLDFELRYLAGGYEQ